MAVPRVAGARRRRCARRRVRAPRARHLGRRSSRQRARAGSPSPRRWRSSTRGCGRAARRRAIACGVPRWPPASLTASGMWRRPRRRGRPHASCSPASPALALIVLGARHAVARAPARQAAAAALRAPALVAVLARWPRVFVLSRRVAIVATHRAREPVAAADLGRPYERVSFMTADGLRLAGLVRAVAQPRRGDRLAGAPRTGRARPHARPPRLRRAAVRPPRRGSRARATSTPTAGAAMPISRPRSASCSRRRDVDPGRIGGLGLSVGGEMMLQAAAQDARLRAVVSEGASVRSLAEHCGRPGRRRRAQAVHPAGRPDRGRRGAREPAPPPSLIEPRRRHRAALATADPRARRADERRCSTAPSTTRRGAPKALWEVPGAGHTARPRGAAAGIRAARRRILRSRTPDPRTRPVSRMRHWGSPRRSWKARSSASCVAGSPGGSGVSCSV